MRRIAPPLVPVALAGALLLALGAGAAGISQHRAPTQHRVNKTRAAAARQAALQQAALRATAREVARLRFTAAADMQRHAYASAVRAYQALLQLAPGDAEAAAALEAARSGACRDAAWAAAARERFAAATTALDACPAAPAPAAAGDVALLRHLAAAAAALQRQDWNAAAAAMRALPATPLPAPLDATLAPAFARFGQGDPRAAAALARPATRAASPLAPPFAAFLRNRYQRRLLRTVAWPALAAYLLLFVASLIICLRRRRPVPDDRRGPQRGEAARPAYAQGAVEPS